MASRTPLTLEAGDLGVGVISATTLAAPRGLQAVLTLRAGQVCAAALELPGEGRRGESGLFAERAGGRSPSRVCEPHRTSPPGRRTTRPRGSVSQSGGAWVGALLPPQTIPAG